MILKNKYMILINVLITSAFIFIFGHNLFTRNIVAPMGYDITKKNKGVMLVGFLKYSGPDPAQTYETISC